MNWRRNTLAVDLTIIITGSDEKATNGPGAGYYVSIVSWGGTTCKEAIYSTGSSQAIKQEFTVAAVHLLSIGVVWRLWGDLGLE